MKSVASSHFFDFVLVVLRVAVAFSVLLEQVWLLEVEVPLLHEVLGVLDVDQQLEDAVVLSMDGLLIDDYFNGPFAVVGDPDGLQVLEGTQVEPCPLPLSILKLNIHITHDEVLIQVWKLILQQFTEALLELTVY